LYHSGDTPENKVTSVGSIGHESQGVHSGGGVTPNKIHLKVGHSERGQSEVLTKVYPAQKETLEHRGEQSQAREFREEEAAEMLDAVKCPREGQKLTAKKKLLGVATRLNGPEKNALPQRMGLLGQGDEAQAAFIPRK
jgi:hypothetical protein